MPPLDSRLSEQLVAANVGTGLPLVELMRWTFGKRRTRAALQRPERDPEFVEFALLLDAQVNRAWKERGISRAEGPYVADAL